MRSVTEAEEMVSMTTHIIIIIIIISSNIAS